MRNLLPSLPLAFAALLAACSTTIVVKRPITETGLREARSTVIDRSEPTIVWADGRSEVIEGKVTSLGSVTTVLEPGSKSAASAPSERSVPTEALRRIVFVSHGAGALEGAALALFPCMAAGIGIGYAAGSSGSGGGPMNFGGIGAVIGAAVGAGVGLVFGATGGAMIGHTTSVDFDAR